MRRHLLSGALLTASLVIAVAAISAVTTTTAAASAATTTSHAAKTAAIEATRVTGQPGRPVFLVTGELVFAGAAGMAGVSLMTGGPGQDMGSAGPLQTLTQGGSTEVMPVTAAPYLGQELAPALFEPRALARAESAGRLPVRIAYSAGLPALPGVTITARGRGTARGYLTARGARRFGSVLARQYVADHASASYGQDGMLHGVDITLAGAPAAPPPVTRPAFPMHTLIVSGTDLSGRPDNGDVIRVFNVDDPVRFGFDSGSFFYHGTARFSVPAGHYYAVANFCCDRSAEHVVIVPQFTVSKATGPTTLHVSERSATSRISFTTQRPAVMQNERLVLLRQAARDGGFGQSWDAGGMFFLAHSLWVSPTRARPTVGTLQSETQATLSSPRSAHGAPYSYELDFPGPRGTIPLQHFTASSANLATIHDRFYQDARSSGSWCTLGGYVFPDGAFSLSCISLPLSLPQDQTQYLSAAPSVVWGASYSSLAGGQFDGFRTYRAGQNLTVGWGAYPLHTQPNVQTIHLGGILADEFTRLPSAFRIGNTLSLGVPITGTNIATADVNPFSDNYPGHVGLGFAHGTATYAVYQDGIPIAHGNPARGISPVQLTARPSLIRFTLTARWRGPLFRLSRTSSTTWTWHSRRQPGAVVPPGWTCSINFQTAQCAVQPMMTLDYHIRRLALDGTTPAGRQVIGLDVGHIQPGTQSRITRVIARVSFTAGRSWRPAAVIAVGGGHFRIIFTARPGAHVTLRTSASDAAGDSITETILRSYQIAAGTMAAATPGTDAGQAARTAHARRQPPGVRMACLPAGPRQARCYALWAPQVTVNAAIAARAAGRPAAAKNTTPRGWGATSIDHAYKLPVQRRPDATVAVVDAFSTPHLAADLAAYRAHYDLPPCTTASGCLRIVNQHGHAGPLPAADPSGWGVEETLDVSMVSAACPRCKILVVEARSPSFADLAVAEDTADRMGAVVISNSYGARESGFTQVYAAAYDHDGHVIVAASGDNGFGPAQFPANLATVTATGGTQLSRASNARGWTEKTWNVGFFGASGSGCSAYVTKPAWQHDPHCPGRAIADVAAVASNIAIYDSSVHGGPWLLVGGTSVSAPLIAGVYALAGNAVTVAPGYEYAHRHVLFDISAGTNDLLGNGAACGYDYLCEAKKGYDAPTGLGTPDGTGAF